MNAVSSNHPELVVYTLSYHDDFKYKGSVEFKYRADSALVNNHQNANGVFRFSIDGNDKKVVSDHLMAGSWFVKNFDVEPGFHSLEWTYMKY